MYHSITIGDKNTWDDWKMIPVSRPVVAPPVEKILSVDVPGRDGTTYLSKSLTGYPVFKAREGSWEFYLDTDEWRGQNLSTPVGTGALEYLSRALAKSSPQGRASRTITAKRRNESEDIRGGRHEHRVLLLSCRHQMVRAYIGYSDLTKGLWIKRWKM